MNQEQHIQKLQSKLRSGVSGLNTIGGLSLLNAALTLFNVDVNFPVGFGISALIVPLMSEFAKAAGAEGIADGLAIRIVGFVASALLATAFILLGIPARAAKWWAFVLAIGLYVVDALFLIALQLWVGGMVVDLIFHALGLYWLFTGLRAANELPEPEQPEIVPGIAELRRD
jgi:hypothetical protein